MTIPWAQNAAIVGQSFVFFVFWLSLWSLVELTTEKYLDKYWKKMVLYFFTLVASIVAMLIFANQFYGGI
jgi:hypothetical protein